MDTFSIKALQTLLQPSEKLEDSDSDKDVGPTINFGPGNIGNTVQPSETKQNRVPKDPKAIWLDEELSAKVQREDVYDPRPEPEYELSYVQAIGTEDIYLQLGNRTPATASCEKLKVKITLDDCTSIAQIEVDISKDFLDVRTSKYKLGLHLPHPVDPDQSKAQWDGKLHLLTLTCQLNRELDDFNF